MIRYISSLLLLIFVYCPVNTKASLVTANVLGQTSGTFGQPSPLVDFNLTYIYDTTVQPTVSFFDDTRDHTFTTDAIFHNIIEANVRIGNYTASISSSDLLSSFIIQEDNVGVLIDSYSVLLFNFTKNSQGEGQDISLIRIDISPDGNTGPDFYSDPSIILTSTPNSNSIFVITDIVDTSGPGINFIDRDVIVESITTHPSAIVPLPAAYWLMGSMLFSGLVFNKYRNQQRY